MRGDWLNKTGRREEAVKVLTEAIENAGRAPFLFAALRERGWVRLCLGDRRGAEADFASAMQHARVGLDRASVERLLALAWAQEKRD